MFPQPPRRFGKSLLISTLENYFLGKKELFRGLAIEKLEKNWYVHPVFKMDFNGVVYKEKGQLTETSLFYIGEWEKIYGNEVFASQCVQWIQSTRRHQHESQI